jgi:hypothetical protein
MARRKTGQDGKGAKAPTPDRTGRVDLAFVSMADRLAGALGESLGLPGLATAVKPILMKESKTLAGLNVAPERMRKFMRAASETLADMKRAQAFAELARKENDKI